MMKDDWLTIKESPPIFFYMVIGMKNFVDNTFNLLIFQIYFVAFLNLQ